MSIPPPDTEGELLDRARAVAGRCLGDLAREVGMPVPRNTLHGKGWVGTLLESVLGATAGSLAEPDFPHLGVELKTLPVRPDGSPKETTYVCVVPLTGQVGVTWESSWVRAKLARVLWMPYQADPALPISERRMGSPLLWEMEPDLEAVLRRDWEELMEMVCLGDLDAITAHHGEYLQIRPKAANARALQTGVGEFGEPIQTLPRGFYLRTRFTREMLRRHFALPV